MLGLRCFDDCKFVIKYEIRKKTKQKESMGALELKGQESSSVALAPIGGQLEFPASHKPFCGCC